MAAVIARPATAAHGGPTRPPGEDRGSISISERVVEKLGAQAIGEVDQFGGAAHRLLGEQNFGHPHALFSGTHTLGEYLRSRVVDVPAALLA